MSSTFFGLNIAYSGLLASNASLNTTANNISNVQTEGYSRQEVSKQAAQAIRTFATYGCAGAGVDTLAVERIRDEFYDAKFWSNNASVGEYNMKSYYMEEMEGYFYDSGNNAGFSQVFDQFAITGMEELLKNPADKATKSQLVGYAGQLTDYFNGVYGNLQEMQKDINSEIKLQIDQINSYSSEIAALNKQINTIELSGQKANELRDQRTRLVDKLSEIVDVQTSETPITDSNNPDRVTGANRYIVKIAGGQILVDMSDYHKLEVVARENNEKVNQTDIDGLYDVYWVASSLYTTYQSDVVNNDAIPIENKQSWNEYVKIHGQKFNLDNAAMGGKLRGLVEMRDGNNGEFFTGTVVNTEVNGYSDTSQNPPVEHDTVTIQVEADWLKDLDKSNLSDQGGIINIGNKEFYYDSWTFNYDKDSDTYTYKFVLSAIGAGNTSHIQNDREGKVAKIGSNIDYQGIPYYMRQMNEWCRVFAAAYNDTLSRGDYDESTGTYLTGTEMFTGENVTYNEALGEQSQFLFDTKYGAYAVDSSGQQESYSVDVSDDSYYRLTAGNFSIVTALTNDPSLMANKFNASDGAEQNDLVEHLRKIATDANVLSFRGASADRFLQSVLSDVALNAASARTFEGSYTNISNSIDIKRTSISGVDEDEEAVNLVKFQNAYNLSSKMIQVFQEIYDRLINQTGV
ncbi:MAG: flagellar hook-associated protein FlgK [Lachnospiraceae bacterium]|nr:flagellar hook-associated protein FlgK [Lachnospiraceae bacterium]